MAAFPLPIGTALGGGIVTAMTLTAYEVTTPAGVVFVPFVKAHPPKAAMPLVTFA